jgi:toxic protein SymE
VKSAGGELHLIAPYNQADAVRYYRRRHEDRQTKIPKGYSLHAALNLKGDWLEAAGFKTHSRVQLSVEQGKIVIELMVENSE